MADIKFSEFPKATTSKDSDELAILQDGVNKMIPSPVLESKIINKTVSRVIEQGGASLNVVNLKGVVPTYADLALITPTPELNDAYQVEADGLVYVYTESGFQTEGEGFVVQPEPNGVVEEGNTEAVSGGEVFEKTLVKDEVLTKKTNLLDGAVLTQGKYINSLGEEVDNPLFSYYTFESVSGLIFAEGNFTGISANSFGAFFDQNGDYISQLYLPPNAILKTGSQKVAFKSPSNVGLIKLSVLTSGIGNYFVTEGVYQDLEGVIKPELISNVNVEKSGAFIYNVIKDKPLFLDFGYMRVASGLLNYVASTSLNSTNLIPVKENDKIIVKNWLSDFTPSQLTTRGQFFDINKRLITSLPAIDSTEPEYIAPAGTEYVSVLFEAVKAPDLSVEVISANTDVKINANSIFGILPENYWENFLFTWFGDSITYRNTWQPYVIAALNIQNYTNLGIGSTCMINAGPTPMCSEARIQAIKDSNPDVVTILAGANDLVYCEGGTSAVTGAGIGDISELSKTQANKDKLKFYGAYGYVIESLLAWKPTLRIFIMGTTWAHNNGATFNTTLRYSDFAEASKKIANYYGLVFIDTYGNVGFNKFTMGASPNNIYSTDQIHPNDPGSKRIAEVVISAFNSIRPLY